jgi:integrase
MALRIRSISWHPRYRFAIGGLRVNGKRKRVFFETLAQAEEELRNLQIKAKRQGEAGLDLPDVLRAMAVECADKLKPFGKTIADATAFYLCQLENSKSDRVDELADAYIRSQERNRLSSRQIADIRRRLGRFVESFGYRPVRTVAASEIEEWLFGLGDKAPQTLVNWRATLRAFFQWLVRTTAIESNPLEAVARPKIIRETPAIWKVDDLRKLLENAPPELVPALAVAAFAGLRQSEILKLDWADVRLERGLIEVRADRTKSARRRLVKILPNLEAWLRPHVKESGPVFPSGWRVYYETTTKLARRLEIPWPANGLRHSYASFHLAHFKDAPALSLEMGHTGPAMLFAHYREVVSPEAAALYWEIRP